MLTQINLLEYLERICSERPEHVVYMNEEGEITSSEIMDYAKRIGSALCAYTGAKLPIVVFAEKSLLTPVLYHAILYAGCFYVPLGTDMPIVRMRTILEIVNTSVILTDGKNEDLLKSLDFGGTILNANMLLRSSINETELTDRRRKSLDIDPAYVIFTSGTTGKPKGIVTSHRAVIDCVDIYADEFKISSDDVIGNQSPLDYIAAVRDIYLPLSTGAQTVLIPKRLFSTPQKLFEYVNEKKITTLSWVAAALVLCSELGVFKSTGLPNIKKVLFAGSVLPCKHLRVWQENLPQAIFINHYGPTEITRSCTYYIVPEKVTDLDVLPIGIPFSNTEIILLGEDGTSVVEDGEIGEICVKSPGLALGYYNDEVKTNEVFINNPHQKVYPERIYKTGDLGRLRTDGNFEFHGRKDFQIKHMGHRIELSEIEIAASGLNSIQNCCCLYLQEKEQIWFFYTGDSDNREIAIYLRERLPSYMIPRKFVKLDLMPISFNGKTDMNTLRLMMEDGA